MLFYFILFYFILFYFILFYFILFYFILFYFILFYFILFYFILFYFILCYFILFYAKICFSDSDRPVSGCGLIFPGTTEFGMCLHMPWIRCAEVFMNYSEPMYCLNRAAIQTLIRNQALKKWWVAEYSGVHKTTLRRWLSGKIQRVHKTNVVKLAEILSTPEGLIAYPADCG